MTEKGLELIRRLLENSSNTPIVLCNKHMPQKQGNICFSGHISVPGYGGTHCTTDMVELSMCIFSPELLLNIV